MKWYLCKICHLGFTESYELAEHLKSSHTDSNLERTFYSCTSCDRRFTTKAGLYSHINVHKPKPASSSTSAEALVPEQSLNNPERDREKKQGAIQKLHTTSRRYKKSPRSVHHKPYSCDQCDMSFRFPSRLVVHKMRHNGKEEDKPCACPTCGMRFWRMPEVRSHQATHNTTRSGVRIKSFPCHLCDSSFTRLRNLTAHKRAHLAVKKPHVCGVCNKAFSTNAQLVAHQRVHGAQPAAAAAAAGAAAPRRKRANNKRPRKIFECELCHSTQPLSFARASELMEHCRSAHSLPM